MILFFIPALFMVASLLASADSRPGRAIIDFEPNNSLEATESIEFDRALNSLVNNADLDDDNDGIGDLDDAFPLDVSESRDTDGDGKGNNTDDDIDGDGKLNADDNYENCKVGAGIWIASGLAAAGAAALISDGDDETISP